MPVTARRSIRSILAAPATLSILSPGRPPRRRGCGLPAAAVEAGRAVHRRRRRRCHGARHGAAPRRGTGPAGHRRQPRRRRRDHGERTRQDGAGRRLHAALRHDGHACDQPGAARQAALRPGQGFLADQPDPRQPARADRRLAPAGEERRGAGRAREVEARRAHLRLRRRRQFRPSVRRAVRQHDRHLDCCTCRTAAVRR